MKTSLSKAKTLLPSETVTRKGENPNTVSHKAIAGIPSEDVASNAFFERIHSSQNYNFAINAITVLKRHAKMRLFSENVGHKVENAGYKVDVFTY